MLNAFEKLEETCHKLTREQQEHVVKLLGGIGSWSATDQIAFAWRLNWELGSHPHQKLPDYEWMSIWMMLAGRGAGKTRAAAENVGWLAWQHPKTRWLLTAPTSADIRATSIEGDSGLINVIPKELILKYNASLGEIHLINGSLLKGIPATEPERFRGTQWHGGWHDELAAWDYLDAAWDQIQFTVRLKTPALGKTLQIITTTPRPKDLIVKLVERDKDDVCVVTASTYVNKDNLSESFRRQIEQYEGTELGRQEIHAEILNPEDAGIIKRKWFKVKNVEKKFPKFDFILQSYDPATSEKQTEEGDPTACIVFGVYRPNDDTGNRVMIIDAWDDKLSYPLLKRKIVEQWDQLYGPEGQFTGGRRADLCLIEQKSAGISLIQDLNLSHVKVRGYNPGKLDKAQRLHLSAAAVIKGLVHLPESENQEGEPKKWLKECLRQLCTFPEASHDDYCDAFSQGIRYLMDAGWINPHREDPYREKVEMFADLEVSNNYADDRGNPYLI